MITVKTQSAPGESRRRQLFGGALIIGSVGLLAIILWLGRAIPGLFGEWFGVLAGIVSTPFLMEASFVVVGFLIVFGLNAWRQRREGDECVYLEQVEGPGAEDLPESARWAIYRKPPLPGEVPDPLDKIEGALEAGELELAAAQLAELDAALLDTPAVMKLRIRLAEASGKGDLAAHLRARCGSH